MDFFDDIMENDQIMFYYTDISACYVGTKEYMEQ